MRPDERALGPRPRHRSPTRAWPWCAWSSVAAGSRSCSDDDRRQHLRPRLPRLRRPAARGVDRSPSGCCERRSRPRTGSGVAAGRRSRRSCCSAWSRCRPSSPWASPPSPRRPAPARRSTRPRPSSTPTYQGLTGTILTLFLAAQAPELFGRDQRYGVLPLYFSRLLTRTDYALARVGGLVLAVFLLSSSRTSILTLGAVLRGRRPADRAGRGGRRTSRATLAIDRPGRRCCCPSSRRSSRPGRRAAPTPRPGSSPRSSSRRSSACIVVELAVTDLGEHRRPVQPGRPRRRVQRRRSSGRCPTARRSFTADLPGWTYVVASIVWIVVLLGVIVRRYLTLTA